MCKIVEIGEVSVSTIRTPKLWDIGQKKHLKKLRHVLEKYKSFKKPKNYDEIFFSVSLHEEKKPYNMCAIFVIILRNDCLNIVSSSN